MDTELTQGKCTDFDLHVNSYLFFYSFCSTYLRCLQHHYQAITPKCIISTRNTVISSCHLKPQMVWKCTWSNLRGSKIQKFSGGACPHTPLWGVLLCAVLLPPPLPLSIFLNETQFQLLVASSGGGGSGGRGVVLENMPTPLWAAT